MLLPSLNGLRAFEAAARHMSFTRAAAELNVTQTAISHQIRRLEEQLGLTLFIRRNRDAGTDARGAGLSAVHPLGVRRSASRHGEAAPHRSRGTADREHHRLPGDQMAGFASGRVPGRQSGHRGAHHDLHAPGRFPARGSRHRRPLRPRRLAWAARPLADGRANLPGVQPGAAERRESRCARRRISRTTRCCTPPFRARTGSFG